MYAHIKSLARVGGSDIPYGDSMETEGASAAARARDSGPKPSLDAKNTASVVAAMKTSVTQVGKAKIAGFSSGSSSAASSIHNHEDAFQKQKGVVAGFGGVKFVTREKEEPKLPPKGSVTGPRVMSMDTMDQHTAEGKARREAIEKRMRASSSGASASSGPRLATLSDPSASSIKGKGTGGGAVGAAAGGKFGGASKLPSAGSGVTVSAPTRKPLAPAAAGRSSSAGSSANTGVHSSGAGHKLGGAGGSAGAAAGAGGSSSAAGIASAKPAAPGPENNNAASLAAHRAALFAAKFAEDKAKKAAASADLFKKDEE